MLNLAKRLSLGLGLAAPLPGAPPIDLLQSILSPNGENYRFWDFSVTPTDRIFSDRGAVPVTSVGSTTFMALDQHGQGSKTVEQIEAPFPDVYTHGSAILTQDAGRTVTEAGGNFTFSGNVSVAPPTADLQIPTTAGKYYRLTYSRTGTISLAVGTTQGAGNKGAGSVPDGGRGSVYFQASGTSIWARFSSNSANAAVAGNVTVQECPLGQALQAANGSAKPPWQNPYLKFDGVDDYLTQDFLASGAGNCIIFHADVPATMAFPQLVTSVFGSNANFGIGFQTNGQLVGQYGLDTGSAIFGGGDNRGQTVVCALVGTGSNVNLYLNGTQVYTGAQRGSPSASASAIIGGSILSGTPGSYFGGVIRRIAYGLVAPTAAQILAISQNWASL